VCLAAVDVGRAQFLIQSLNAIEREAVRRVGFEPCRKGEPIGLCRIRGFDPNVPGDRPIPARLFVIGEPSLSHNPYRVLSVRHMVSAALRI
jgi:hypothetical protein